MVFFVFIGPKDCEVPGKKGSVRANRQMTPLARRAIRRAAGGAILAEKEIQAGSYFVNTFVRSDPRLPFGGIKESGYGRELSHYGIKEFVNIKTVFVK